MDVTIHAGVKPTASVNPKTVTINGVEISKAAIALEVQNHPAARPTDAWRQAACALAIRELLLQQSRTLPNAPTPLRDAEGRYETMDEALVRTIVEHDVKVPEPDEAACNRYYTQNLRRFRSPDLFEVAHILLHASPREAASRQTVRQIAEEMIVTLKLVPEEFARLAKVHSACPSRDVGGNLGQIGPGQTVPEFEKALAGMPVGQVNAVPVESRYGLHVVKVERRIEGRQLPFDLVHDRIADYLRTSVNHAATRQYISLLAGRATITGIDLDGSQTPLVQ